MKRFITYLYEYEGEAKTKNTGFVRVDERNGIVNMQVSVRNYIRSREMGKVYALTQVPSLKAVELGEISVINGQGEVQIQFSEASIMGSEIALDEVVGIGIWFVNNGYLASCWRDEAVEEIGRWKPWRVEPEQNVIVPAEIEAAEIGVAEEETVEVEIAEVDTAEVETAKVEVAEVTPSALVTYRKIELTQIRKLSSKNWYLCSNRFLQHGFWNYGYLVLEKEIAGDKEMVSLGVPGVFEEAEMDMATLFGFPKFQALPVEIQTAPMNEEIKSQKPNSGNFGCWLVRLQM